MSQEQVVPTGKQHKGIYRCYSSVDETWYTNGEQQSSIADDIGVDEDDDKGGVDANIQKEVQVGDQ